MPRTPLYEKKPAMNARQNLHRGRLRTASAARARREAEEALSKSKREYLHLEEQLKMERSHLVAAQGVARVGSWETNPATLAVNWSEETHRIFETNPLTFHPTHPLFLELVHPDDRAAVDEAITGSIGTKEDQMIVHRILLPDGRIKHVEDRWRVFYDDLGHPLRVIGTCQDITERHDAEQKLKDSAKESEQRKDILDTVLAATSDFAYIFNREGRFVFANEPLLALWGISLEAAVGKNFFDLEYPTRLAERLQAQIQEVFEKKQRITGETAYTSPTGTDGYYEYIFSPVIKADGSVHLVAGATRDITARKLDELALRIAERALHESEERMLFALESAGIGDWDLDLRTNIARGSILHDQCFGYGETGPGWDYKVFLAHVHSADREQVDAGFQAAMAGEGDYDEEFRVTWPDGSLHWLWTKGRFYFDETGKAHRVTGIVTDITARRRTNALLRESEQRLNLATESARIGIWDWDVVHDKLLWDKRMYELYGIQEGDFSGAVVAWQRGLHPEDRERSEAELLAAVQGDRDFHTEFRVKWPNGEIHHIEAHGLVVREATGSATRIIGVNWDITARKLLEQETERTLRRLTEAQHIGQIGDWEWEIATQSITWSPQVFEIFKRDPVLGPPRDFEEYKAIFDAPSQALMEEKSTLALGSGEAQHYEIVALRPEGGKIHLHATAVPRKDENGRVLGLYGTIQDITERRAIEERILEQAELLDLAHDAIMVRDLDNRIQFWNRGAEAIYGWTSAEAIGRTAHELLHIDPEKYSAATQCLLKTGEWTGELNQIRKNGASVIIHTRWTLLRDEEGRPKSTLVISTDITEHKKLEAQFLRAQRLESVGTLASGVAHDLNNILAPILMALPMLREEMPADLRENIVANLETSAQRGAEIVRQVLTFARGAEGERLLVQMTHLIKDMAHIAEDTFPKSIIIRANYPHGLLTVDANPTQLHQVLLNLCVNARDAMPGGGALVLSADNMTVDEAYAAMSPGVKMGKYVRIQVSDTGAGIPPEIIGQIFDPFFTTKEVGTGTGLGLSTTIGIVKSHGGFIEVDSEVGVGTTFNIFLPAAGEEKAGIVEVQVADAPQGHGELLLVVDDEQSIREMAKTILERQGYRVILAADGVKALAIFGGRMKEISAVITDLMMPLMDGITLIRTVRKMKPGIIVIASTGRSDDKRMKELGTLDVPICLIKPYHKRRLLDAVRDSLPVSRNDFRNE